MELKVLQQSELKNNVAVVLGTRPEIIKLGPVILALKRQRKRFFIIHTGQHYSMSMDGQFFKDLGLPRPLFSYREMRLSRGVSASGVRGVSVFMREGFYHGEENGSQCGDRHIGATETVGNERTGNGPQ